MEDVPWYVTQRKLAEDLEELQSLARLKVDQTLAVAVKEDREAGGIEHLYKLFVGKDSSLRDAAAQVLIEIGDERVVSAFLVALVHDDRRVRKAAAVAFESIKPVEAVEPLIVALTDPDIDVRIAAAATLGSLGDSRAAIPLLDALGCQDKTGRQALTKALGSIHDLSEKTTRFRLVAVGALVNLRDPAAIVLLSEILSIGDPNLCSVAFTGLGKIGGGRAFDVVVAALDKQDYIMRSHAVRTLAAFPDQRVLDAVLEALTDERSEEVRRAAVDALRQLECREALPALKARLRPFVGEANAEIRTRIRAVVTLIEATTGATACRPRVADADAPEPTARPRTVDETPQMDGRL